MRRFWSLLLIVLLICGAIPAQGTVTPSEPDPSAQGWIDLGPDGVHSGDLYDLIGIAQGGKIYVQARNAVEIEGIFPRLLEDVEFEPDPEVFTGGEHVVRITLEDPDEAEDISLIEDIDLAQYADAPEDALITVYIWVMQILPTPEPTPTPTPTPMPEPTSTPVSTPTPEPTPLPTPAPTPLPTPEPVKISVEAEGLRPGEWSPVAPQFSLSGIPEGEGGLCYAAILYDRQIVEMDGSVYRHETEGICALRFAIMDEMGDIVSVSASYTIYLDLSAPESVSAVPSTQRSYAMVLTAADSLSGAKAYSTDGGAEWIEMASSEPVGCVFSGLTVLEPGMLCVQDGAGNIWKNEEQLTFGALEKPDVGGYYGPAKPHSENTTGNDGTTGYAQAYLCAAEEPIEALDVGGRLITLSVSGNDAQSPALFGVSFGAPCDEAGNGGLESLHTGEKTEKDSMIMLTAEPAEAEDGVQCEYIWQFDGAALRTLYASGIDLLVCRTGESAAVFPTIGFTAGTAYTDLKIGGTASRYFLYSASMRPLGEEEKGEPDAIIRTEKCAFTLAVDVKEERYALVPADSVEMYTQGVFCIPQEWIGMDPAQWPEENRDAAF